MTHVDLFSGIGGFALACRWCELETICFCERDPYCQKILAKHWPHVPIASDIREFDGTRYTDVTNPNWVEWLMGYPTGWSA